MQEANRPAALFADARLLYDDAVEALELGKLRIAAEAAWGATRRATDALILARTGRAPQLTGQTSNGMRVLSHADPELAPLRELYGYRARVLHGDCFYSGDCGPPDAISDLIRETDEYIRHAERFAETRNGRNVC